ncbi:transcription initiation factor TFIIIB [Neobacillus novalis]|uniref:Transcription initiation factor TFIIIB n=1 Tax=Neobacillus novalis TaxID=220687 RepID=A0AA95MJ87_9BACI|nr:transcription initiation factor TFIIIB [Neobacillus novalis]WHY84691.1 transcription initiation factor TFIIIB [Neobacillus novalis]
MEIDKLCPMCGGSEIGKGRTIGQGGMVPIKSLMKGSMVYADICTECGHILSMRVEKPEMFKNKN